MDSASWAVRAEALDWEEAVLLADVALVPSVVYVLHF